MHDFSTPMMRQYKEIKEQYKDCLLFYRMGDFYELFMEDAHMGAAILNITLTSKSGGKDGKIPMAGVPYHAVDSYIAKLVKAGHKVAICEQLTPPNKKGLVERDVVRIVTPGTLMDENILEKKENNYIITLTIVGQTFALTVADLSTGFLATEQREFENAEKTLLDEIARLKPTECLLPDELYNNTELLKLLRTEKTMNIFPYEGFTSDITKHRELLKKHFGVITLQGFGIDEQELAIITSATLLKYLQETQKGNISHIKKIISLQENDGLVLDRSTIINLELFSTIRDHDTSGSLLSILDNTITAMGGRLLKQWMKKPLAKKEDIEERLDSVEAFSEQPEFREILREQLRLIPDIERLLSRLSVNLGNARDLINLKQALNVMLQTKKLLTHLSPSLLQKAGKSIAKELEEVVQKIDTVIADEPPISTKDGGMIKPGINESLENLRTTIKKSKDWIVELERKEKVRTGITTLKVRFNKVFGFYIEISKGSVHLAPKDYMRKQTLVNGERFITKELKEHEEIILSAEEKVYELEYQIFTEVLQFVLSYTEHIQQGASSIAVLDCLSSFSFLSEKERYVKPRLLYSGEIRITQGRHPVVEKLLDDPFIPNDVILDNVSQSLLLITGPNMAGKSVLIRQVALIVLMAQMGCYVPAQKAHIALVDKIFVRSGASDVITSGLSTFMVEMVETAHILNTATKNSLIVMDEIGRGTSTYDGISIAWAVAEYLVTKIKPSPKVLFATHYHELQDLEKQYPDQIKNFHMAVTEQKGEPVFLHTILSGGASHSFGVAVAKLAGVPQSVIDKAYEMLQTLEFRQITEKKEETALQVERKQETMSFQELANRNENLFDHILIKELESLDIANITPIEALNKLAEIKDKVKLLSSESKNYLEAD